MARDPNPFESARQSVEDEKEKNAGERRDQQNLARSQVEGLVAELSKWRDDLRADGFDIHYGSSPGFYHGGRALLTRNKSPNDTPVVVSLSWQQGYFVAEGSGLTSYLDEQGYRDTSSVGAREELGRSTAEAIETISRAVAGHRMPVSGTIFGMDVYVREGSSFLSEIFRGSLSGLDRK